MEGLLKTILVSIFALLLCSTPALAGELSVHVVDIQRVLDESIAGKAARSDMEELAKKEQAEMSMRQSEFAREGEELGKQKGLLSSEALEEKKISLEKRQREYVRQLQDKREDLGKRGSAAVEKVVSQIDKVIAEMTASGQYPFIIERDPRFVVFVNERFDLTAEVIKRLNQKTTGL